MLCQIGSQRMGIDIRHVKAVHRISDVSPSRPDPHIRQEVSKVCLLDSEESDLYELHQLFGCAPSAESAQKVMTIQLPDRQAGFCVDQIERVIEAGEDKIHPLPAAFQKKSTHWFPTVLMHGEHLIPLLNPQGVDKAPPEAEHPPSSPEPELTAWGEKMISGKWLANRMVQSVRRHLKRSVDREIQKIRIHRQSLRKWLPQNTLPGTSTGPKDHRQNRVLIFRANAPKYWNRPVFFLFSLRQICEILPHLPVFPIPFAPNHVHGMIRWRRHIAPVISLETSLGFQDARPLPSPRMMVVRSSRKDTVLIIRLNAAVRIMPLPESHPLLSRFLGLQNPGWVHGVYGWDEGFLVAAHIEHIAGGET